ncbi:hypothetical protein QO179_23850 [Bacillus stercoris]|nr:hypothetical protein [Bacillus stercoris]
MAIVKGLEPGAILWKFKAKEMTYGYCEEQQRYRHFLAYNYYVYKLETRRARTNGSSISQSLIPFFEKLKIKILSHSYSTIAVGVRLVRISEKEWNESEIDEIAAKRYKYVSKSAMISFLEKEDPLLKKDSLQEFYFKIKEDSNFNSEEQDVDKWPDEPEFVVTREYRHSLSY